MTLADLIAEARELADGIDDDELHESAALIRRLAAALEEAEKMTGALAVALRVNAYRAGHSTEDVDKMLREIGYMPADTARAAMEALDGAAIDTSAGRVENS